MDEGQGVVQVGATPEPLIIATPTSIEGTLDGGEDGSGAITAGTFSTPPIEFEAEAPPLLADVVATFDQLGPVTGQVDGAGNVDVDVRLGLTLDISLGGSRVGICRTEPIVLELGQVAPYDPATQAVTLADPQFAIPPVTASDSCSSIVAGAVNPQLAGANNSISLGLRGSLDLPPPPGEPSTVSLVSGAATTRLGAPATFTATVAAGAGAAAAGAPTGSVTFFSGTTTIGQAAVAGDLTAQLTTSALPVGSHQVTARYSGDSDYSPSTSAPLGHVVTAIPNLTADVPDTIVTGGAPKELTATLTNPASGQPQPRVRLDLRFGPRSGLTNGALVVEHWSGGVWAPITLSGTSTQSGSYGGIGGFALAPGETREVRLRISATASAAQGALPVEMKVNEVDGGGAVLSTFGTTTASSTIVPAGHRPTQVTLAAPAPAQIRQGHSVALKATVSFTAGTGTPTGPAQLFVDGRLVEASDRQGGLTAPTWNLGSGGAVTFHLVSAFTRTLATGTHQFSIRYAGSTIAQPSSSTLDGTFTVVSQPTAHPYECTVLGFADTTRGGRLEVSADLPAVAVPGSVSLDRLEIGVVLEPDTTLPQLPSLFAGSPTRRTSMTLAPGGTGTFEGVTVTPLSSLEHRITLVNPSASVPIEGEPGDVVPVAFDQFSLIAEQSGFTFGLRCAPVGDPEPLGQVLVAGTTLSASTTEAVEGEAVVLTATVAPTSAQGVVEFFDGTTSLGIAPLQGGRAVLPVDALAVGARKVTARHLGDLVSPPTTSEPVTVEVRPIDCPSFAVAGNGAVVRAVYIELLRRCPDQAGFDHWVGRLDGGVTRESFARAISSSVEARKVVANDAYLTMLGRDGDPAGLSHWAGYLARGRYDELLTTIGSSGEYWRLAGSTNEGFVARTYERLLGRAPDAAGLEHWTGRLDAGTARATMLRSFTRLAEPVRAVVRRSFQEMLDRDPSPSELTAEAAAYADDGSRSGLYGRLIGTSEFAQRAQSFPN